MNAAVRILHLEDDPADARLIREQLRRSGLDVTITVAGSRESFETALPAGAFDVVLSDYHIPNFSGLEALEVVRRTTPHLPFILVTGALGDEAAVDLLRGGATDCVLKDRLARLAPAIQRAISEHAAKTQHEEVQARLAEAQRLSKLATEAAHMGTWHLDIASGKLDCSDEFLRLVGVRRADWPGTIDALEALMHPEDVERRRSLYADAVQHGQFMEQEFRIAMRGGEMRWMYFRGDFSNGAHGTPRSLVGIMMDITERKQMEEALRDADRRKDEFLATLAHELRNLLAPIYSGLSVLRRSAEQSSEAEKIHEMLDRQMNHIIRLVDDLLDVSRYTLGKVELKRAPIELQTVLQNAIDMSRPLIEAARHQLDVAVPLQPVILDADGVRLAQAMSNLLNNAAKYTVQGGHLWLSARVQDDWAVISVRDTGVGIPEAMLDRVFDLFTQVDGSVALGRPGLGIGLAMVRMLIELHGGDVEARSAGLGQGSEFIVRLPVSETHEAAGAKGSNAMPDASLSGHRVLVVDDNGDAADSLGMLLKLAGAEVHVAYDGVSALAAMPIHHPDIVFVDIGMPGMDGYTVASRIRQDSQNRNVTLIALTGFGQQQDRQRATDAGFNHHLTKPADFDMVHALLVSLAPLKRSKLT